MAIEKTYLLGKNITLGCGFDLQAKAPLDSRQVVPEYDGLQALIDGNAAYEGMIVYDEGTKKTYQAQLVDGVLAFREFGINEAELKDLIASETTAAMEFKGAANALPENPSKGDFYKVTTAFDVAEGENAKVGDSIVYDGEQWFIIPSGDDIEDTWRPVTDVDNDATLTFVAGDKLDVAVAANGTVTYSHEEIDAPTVAAVGEDEQTRTYIASIETDGYGHIVGYKTATENVEDTNTTYEFEGLPVVDGEAAPSSVYFQVKSSEAEAAEVIYVDAYNKNEVNAELAKKVDKAEGFSLVDDDEIEKLAGVSEGANKVEASETNGSIKIDGVDTVVYTHPDKHVIADVDGLQGVLDAKVAQATYDEDKATFATKTELGDVDAKFSDYVTSASYAEDKADLDEAIADRYTKEEADGKFALIADAYNDSEVRGLIGDNAQAIEDLETYVGTIPTDEKYANITNVISYVNKKAEETLAAAQGGSSETAASVKQQLDNYKSENDTRVKAAEDAIDAIEADYLKSADKTELSNAIAAEAERAAGIEGGLRTDVDEIKADYLKAADIADFETKENVKKVADDLAAYVESNDAALAAETKARTDADADFETRISALEGNFGDGEGTVEAQIAAAVKVEEDARKEAVKGVQDEVDAVKGRMDTAEGKIVTLETESAKHAIKTEVEGALALKADKSVVDAMYTNGKIDELLAGKVDNATYAEDKATFALKSEITTLGDKADKSYVDEELAKKVNVSDYNTDKATFVTKTELQGVVDAQTEVNEDFEGRIADLEAIDRDKLATDAAASAVATVLDGAPAKFDTLKEIAAWIAEADTAEDAASLVTRVSALEAIDHDAYVDADSELKEELEGKINAINNHSHTFVESELNEIKSGDVAKWNAEIGAKALAELKLNASTFTEYSSAHADDYTNKQIDDAIDADVKTAIDAEVERTEAVYSKLGHKHVVADIDDYATDVAAKIEAYKYATDENAQKYASDAQAAAEATASGELASAKSELEGKINAIDNHSHTNKAELDKIADGDVAKWNAAEQNAKDYADGLNTAMDGRVAALEDIDHDDYVSKSATETQTIVSPLVVSNGESGSLYRSVKVQPDKITLFETVMGTTTNLTQEEGEGGTTHNVTLPAEDGTLATREWMNANMGVEKLTQAADTVLIFDCGGSGV